jgi:hypothetical protein
MAANVDPNRVIQKLTAALSATQVELVCTQVALEDANAVIAKHGMGEPSPDGQ